MPSRRAHRKSHHGCKACKQRKIKCDEGRPECGPCQKKQLSCSFRLDSYHQPAADLLMTIKPSSSEGQIQTLDNTLPLLELQLLHQWHTSTAPGLFDNREVQRVMTAIIPWEGLAHPFLMHGVLAIAALHHVQLHDSKNSMTLIEAAVEHKQKALSLYIPQLSNITETNCKALFAFSCLLSILSFGSQSERLTRTANDIADLVSILYLVRGVATIVIAAKKWIEDSEMSALLLPGQFNPRNHGADDGTHYSIEDASQWHILLEHCHATCKDDEDKTVYLETIELLIGSHVASSTVFDNIWILAWPSRIDSQFLDLLLQRKHMALVIFAHYGAVMVLLDNTWWLKGWGQLVIGLVSETLPPSELSHISWPLKLALKKEKKDAYPEVM